MKGKNFLTLNDFTTEEVVKILSVAEDLKSKLKSGTPHQDLRGKTLGMIFQKPSNRTRVSFEVGMFQLGGHALNIRPSEIRMKEREPIADVARVMSRYVDAVMLRVDDHNDLVEFARAATVPVINGLSDLYHPCQAVADILTIKEHKKELRGLKLCYVGDGNNVCRSLINISKHVGIDVTVCCPKGYELKEVPAVYDPIEAVSDADVIYTDVWTSMGQEEESSKRLNDFSGYTITKELLAKASDDVIFMHCLPAHRDEEVTDEVVEASNSVVFDQAENRLHAQKAILKLLLSSNASR